MKLSEFDLIKALSRKLTFKSDRVIVGIGDDTAVVKNDTSFTLLTSDGLVEGTHYKAQWEPFVKNLYFFLGRKLLSISLSDIASMGGIPEYALVNLGISSSVKSLELLYDGLSDASINYNVSVVGGDTVYSKTEFFDIFVSGKSNNYMLRSKAVEGDLVGITGCVGDAAAGMEAINLKVNQPYLIHRFLNPTPRLAQGEELLKLGVKCATDISDGLAFNLYTIANSSGVRIELDSSSIPISDELKLFSRSIGKNPMNFALYGGEDYELIFTFPESLRKRIESLGFNIIGSVKKGNGIYIDGKKVLPNGFDQLLSKR
ncbi:MAG: thiamine-phosphate kinase [Nitrospiraceae bacterium]|nr:thiamine-phosphate kinase [Nitrospiraceae bacterium]